MSRKVTNKPLPVSAASISEGETIPFYGNKAIVRNLAAPDRFTGWGEQVFTFNAEIVEGPLKGTGYDGGFYTHRNSDSDKSLLREYLSDR